LNNYKKWIYQGGFVFVIPADKNGIIGVDHNSNKTSAYFIIPSDWDATIILDFTAENL
jgi:hypothetical protein